MRYALYLKSAAWDAVKLVKLKLVEYRCEECGNRSRLNVHHVNYRYVFKELDHLDCLRVLCDQCHKYQHGLGKPTPKPKSLQPPRKRVKVKWEYVAVLKARVADEKLKKGCKSTRYYFDYNKGKSLQVLNSQAD